MKCSAHFKAVLNDSWITVGSTSLHQHKLRYYCTIGYLSHSENSTSCVIQGPDQDFAVTHQRLQSVTFTHQTLLKHKYTDNVTDIVFFIVCKLYFLLVLILLYATRLKLPLGHTFHSANQ